MAGRLAANHEPRRLPWWAYSLLYGLRVPDDQIHYPSEVPNRAAGIFRMAGHVGSRSAGKAADHREITTKLRVGEAAKPAPRPGLICLRRRGSRATLVGPVLRGIPGGCMALKDYGCAKVHIDLYVNTQ